MNLIIEAAQFAKRAHGSQVRKYTGRPYIEHPMRVAGSLMLVPGVTDDVVAAGWLHDVLEDCFWCARDLVNTFGEQGQVLKMVGALTNQSQGDEHKHKPRAERKRIDCEYLAQCDSWVKVAKLTDRLDNLREMGDGPEKFRLLYCKESVQLAEALRPRVDYAIGSGCDSRVQELERLYHEIIALTEVLSAV